MTTLVIATRNAHKAQEIRAILGDGFQCCSLADFDDAPTVVEDAPTFAGNARKKAVELAQWLATIRDTRFTVHDDRTFVLADDSGLEVDALNGAPGVHSARFAALDAGSPSNSQDADNNAKLLRLLADVPAEKRTARFRCVLALAAIAIGEERDASGNPRSAIRNPQFFHGVCEGRIAFGPSGRGGFGYDPLFVPVGFEQSFAELGEEVKNRLSHRARALEKLRPWFSQHR